MIIGLLSVRMEAASEIFIQTKPNQELLSSRAFKVVQIMQKYGQKLKVQKLKNLPKILDFQNFKLLLKQLLNPSKSS